MTNYEMTNVKVTNFNNQKLSFMRLGPSQDYNVKNVSNFLYWKIKDSQDLDQYCLKQPSLLLGVFCDLCR